MTGLAEYTDTALAFGKVIISKAKKTPCHRWPRPSREQRRAWDLTAKSPSPSRIPKLCELASKMCSLPTYLTPQYSLDWHYISQEKWKRVPTPGAQPKKKRTFGSGTRVRRQSSWVRIPGPGGGWHFAGENVKKAWSQVHNGLQKLSVLEDPKIHLQLFACVII